MAMGKNKDSENEGGLAENEERVKKRKINPDYEDPDLLNRKKH